MKFLFLGLPLLLMGATYYDNRETYVQVAIYNTKTDTFPMVIEGLCSVDMDENIHVICKVDNDLKEHVVHMTDDLAVIVETSNVSADTYNIAYKVDRIYSAQVLRGGSVLDQLDVSK